jgi:CBS domain-containing protein
MSRRTDRLDALLQYLGSVYYQTLHGDATPQDLAGAVASVEAEQASGPAGASPPPHVSHGRRTGRWRVRDVMLTDPVTVELHTAAKDIAELMSEHQVSAVPVADREGRVAGVVSRSDLPRPGADGLRQHSQRPRAPGDSGHTAADLMSAPAITIGPEAPLAAAARLMDQHQIRLLPVVTPEGDLLGVVSLHNLLAIFLRPDTEIADEVRSVLRGLLLVDPGWATVSAHDGIITLTGQAASEETRLTAIQLASGVDGVTHVIDHLTVAPPPRWLGNEH